MKIAEAMESLFCSEEGVFGRPASELNTTIVEKRYFVEKNVISFFYKRDISSPNPKLYLFIRIIK